ncbi:FecR family protein [Aliifodinibius sp. S!AR15-10]|uniref:FecR family protein n=1 Tax=Aliifodinibius sp. S!AR15-10 TaxID=2950437 RepID=UPI002860BA0A|nr:FecR family protein [Aliifodinibius sp. S!AR15-10]MDR8392549.1 FecR family protein [Aliifodinibius sp. S!AR15-10]
MKKPLQSHFSLLFTIDVINGITTNLRSRMGNKITSVDELSKNISFIRWVKGTALPAEIHKWDKWLGECPLNEKLARKAQQIVLGIDFVHPDYQDVNQEWNELAVRIDSKSLRSYWARRNSNSRSIFFLKIAAILLMAAVTGVTSFFIYNSTRERQLAQKQSPLEWRTIKTEFKEQKTIVLSDGSSITLNANSSITYPSGWVRGNVTEVHLKGEAYFSIASREGPNVPPFKVQTPDGTIQVLGTKFVVKTGPKRTNVALEEGSVTILKNTDGTKDSVGSYQIKPNELATFSRSKEEISVREFKNIRIFTSWTENELLLDHSPFTFMVSRIKDIYGVEIKVLDKKLCERTLTGTVKLKDLEYVIASISKVIEAKVTYSNGIVYFGNTN